MCEQNKKSLFFILIKKRTYLFMMLSIFILFKSLYFLFQGVDVDTIVILGRCVHPPSEPGVVEDGHGEVIHGGHGPDATRDVDVAKALQDARQVLAGAARDADAFGVRRDAVVPAEPFRQAAPQRLIALVGAVLQDRGVHGGVRDEHPLARRRELLGRQQLGGGPTPKKVDLCLLHWGGKDACFVAVVVVC